MRKKFASIVRLLLVAASIGITGFFNVDDAFAADGDLKTIYATEDTTLEYDEYGNFRDGDGEGVLSVGYLAYYNNKEGQTLLKFDLPTIPAGFEIESASLYFPVLNADFNEIDPFSLKVSTSTNHSWVAGVVNPNTVPKPTIGSTQSIPVSNNPQILGPIDITRYIIEESLKTTPKATLILSAFSYTDAKASNTTGLNHFIVTGEKYSNYNTPHLTITYSKIQNIEIEGVENGVSYKTDVTPQFNIGTATLNGAAFQSGTKLSIEGSYILIVTANGKSETVQFEIDKTRPTATVLINNGRLYTNTKYSSVSITPDSGVNDIKSMRYSINGGAPTIVGYNSSFFLNTGDTDGAKSVTIELIDAAGNVSPLYAWNFTKSNMIPTGTVTINSGAAYTADPNVTLDFTLGSGVTDVVSVQFSNDNVTWSSEQTYSASMSYTLPAGDGNKTVYARFIDRAGNVGSAQASIELDETAPIVDGVTNGGRYNSEQTITFNEGTAKLNGNSFISGSSVDAAGSYVLVVTDDAGNSTTITFDIFQTYTVSYDGNGATGGHVPVNNQTYETGNSVTVSNNAGSLVKTGFTFNGWNTEADGSGTSYGANDTFNISAANVTLYAKWQYTVKFDTDGGSVVVSAIVDPDGLLSPPAAPTKAGRIFVGWYTDVKLTNEWNFATDIVQEEMTLYAKWRVRPTPPTTSESEPTPEPTPEPEDKPYKTIQKEGTFKVTKVWTVKLSREVDASTVQDALYIVDAEGNRVQATFTSDGKYIFIAPPAGTYREGTYTLYITSKLKDKNGNTLKEPIKMIFTIK